MGSVASEFLSGCAGAVARVCGALCVRASSAESGSNKASEEFTWSVCAVARVAGAAAARSKAGGEAVTRVPVSQIPRGFVRSASEPRSARRGYPVAIAPYPKEFFLYVLPAYDLAKCSVISVP